MTTSLLYWTRINCNIDVIMKKKDKKTSAEGEKLGDQRLTTDIRHWGPRTETRKTKLKHSIFQYFL